MSRLLPADCLNEIFEYLEEDKLTLHSCLLVNRLWCEVSVRILWRNVWNFKYFVSHEYRLEVASSNLNTLIACLPNESKELLNKNEIFISTPTSKPPLFNYAAFCKVLSISDIDQMINKVFDHEPIVASNTSLSLKDRKCLVAKEIIKMFMNQRSSLKKLTYFLTAYDDLSVYYTILSDNISFTSF